MKSRLTSFLTLFLFHSLLSQSIFKYLDKKIYQEKTPSIIKPFDSTMRFEKINVLSLVEYRLYFNEKVKQNILDSSFNCKSAENPATYVSRKMLDTLPDLDPNDRKNSTFVAFPKNYAVLKEGMNDILKTKLEDYSRLKINFPVWDESDLQSIKVELRALKIKLRDSLLFKYRLSDNLKKILAKYSSDVLIISDIVMYNNDGPTYFLINTCSIVRIFLFDLRNNDLIIYDYKTSYDTIGYYNFGLYEAFNGKKTIVKDYKKLLVLIKPYLLENRKYLLKFKTSK